MKNIFDKIIENKKIELANRKKQYPSKKLLQDVSKLLERRKPNDSFIKHLVKPNGGDIGIIAEIKLCSPSAGRLAERQKVRRIVSSYAQAQADAVSVVTEEKFFCGSLELIREIKTTTTLPLLQKDFIMDEYQVLESAKCGSDALLFIAQLRNEFDVSVFELCKRYGIVPVIEIVDEKDLNFAEHAEVIGVNARNLIDFTIDVERACRIIEKLPKEKITIGFSGVKSRKEVEMYKQAGAKAVLVGTGLLKSTDILSSISNLNNL